MFNKKTIFNVVYALAIFGLISTCFEILSELRHFSELHKLNIYSYDVFELIDSQEKKLINYYRVIFFLCSISTVAFIAMLFLKKKTLVFFGFIIATSLSLITCITMFSLNTSLLKFFTDFSFAGDLGSITSDKYLIYTTFRSAAFAFACYAAILVACNVIRCTVYCIRAIRGDKYFDTFDEF